MARSTKPRAKRKKSSFKEDYERMPSGDEAAARWGEFMKRLDELNAHLCEISDLGETLVLALTDAAEKTGSPLLGLINKVASSFREARQQYRGG